MNCENEVRDWMAQHGFKSSKPLIDALEDFWSYEYQRAFLNGKTEE